MSTRPLLLALALSGTLLTGCSAGSETVTTDDPVAQLPSAESSAPVVTPSAEPSPAVRVITASYAAGEVVVPEARVQTTLNEQVVLRISSDVPEEVHVHGYDVYADIPAGGSVDIPLTLRLPGAYEVELHGVGRVLFQLRTA